MLFLVGGGGFEPPKSLTTDLQSAPFGHSGTLPNGASDRNRTSNLLITNQLLCLLSYTSTFKILSLMVPRGGLEPPTRGFSVPCSTNWATEALSVLNEAASLSLPHSFWRPEGGSNPWPPAWQAGVLTNCTTGPYFLLFLWWAFTDSNRGPIGYEPTALTNWAKGP